MATKATVGTLAVALTAEDAGLRAALDQANSKIAQLGAQTARNTTGASAGVKSLSGAFRALAIQATGLNPQVARIGEVLGTMAAGSTLVLGVVGGIAAISFAFKELTAVQRELQESVTDSLDSVRELRLELDFGAKAPLLQQQANIRAQIELLNELIAKRRDDNAAALEGRGPGGLFVGGIASDRPDEKIEKWERQVRELTDSLLVLDRALAQVKETTRTSPGGSGGAPLQFTVPSGFLASTFAPFQFGRPGGAGGASPFAIGQGSGPGGIFSDAGLGFSSDLPSTKSAPTSFGGKGKDLASGAIAAAKATMNAAKATSAGSSAFANAGQTVVSTFGAMAEAAITGSNTMASAITSAVQSVVANIGTKGGGLFGASLPGALIGAGIGIIGSLFSGRDRAPVRVHVDDFGATAAQKLAQAQAERPVQVRLNLVTPDGQTIEQYEYLLRNRAARDGVPRRTGPR